MEARGTLAELASLLRAMADRQVRLHLVAALLLVVAGGVLAALAPLALKAMVDGLAGATTGPGAAIRDAARWGAAYLLALCGARLLTDIRPLFTATADQRLYTRLTERFFGHVLSLPMAYLLRRRAGELLHSLDLATSGCQLVLGHVTNSILPVLVELVAMTVVLIELGQPALVAAFGLSALAYLLVFGGSSRQLVKEAHAVSAASLDLHALMADHLQGSETLKCLAAEAAAASRVDAAAGTLEARWQRLSRLRARIGLAVTATFTLSMAASLLMAGEAVASGSLSVGGFVLANVYMIQMVRPVELLGSAARDLTQALGFVRPLLEILREPAEAQNADRATSTRGAGPGAVAPHHTYAHRSPALRFENVRFGYERQRQVIKDLDLEIPGGRSIALVGTSGSGKSTLARLLLRLHAPQSGRILLDGRPVTELPIAGLRRRIGLVSQEAALLHDTIAANIALGRPGASARQVEDAARSAQLHEFIAGLPAGYDTVVGERGLHLSGGERQRLAIARVVLMQPSIYVFDEATSMLDSRTEVAVLGHLQAHTSGRTTITIAHRLSTVMNADEILVIDEGRIAERGRHDVLVAQGGLYASLWHRQWPHCTETSAPQKGRAR